MTPLNFDLEIFGDIYYCGKFGSLIDSQFARVFTIWQHFRDSMSGKLHLKLGNYSLCCLPVNLNYLEEIGQVVHHYQECMLPNEKQVRGDFLKRARRKCGWGSSRACAGRYIWQTVQRKTKSLISALILGQYKISRARRTHTPMPMWLLWSCVSISFRSERGTTSCSPRKTRPCDSINSIRSS